MYIVKIASSASRTGCKHTSQHGGRPCGSRKKELGNQSCKKVTNNQAAGLKLRENLGKPFPDVLLNRWQCEPCLTVNIDNVTKLNMTGDCYPENTKKLSVV